MADHPHILDVRPEVDFLAGHLARSASIPLEELARRVHELPPENEAIGVFDSDAGRVQRALEFLQRRGHEVWSIQFDPGRLSERGPARTQLWQPSGFLVEAIDRIRATGSSNPGRPALDVACGSGRDAVYLATIGYEVHAIDVLPDALARAGDLA
ncbi:MAG TPA: rhodanese-like domain-containing protein, partial [Bryobacteraceae bacterium]|nr:rhodanese-like domain-containing protein [Bryobacteraceae bacterium]